MSFSGCWFDAFEVKLWSKDLLRDSLGKIKLIQERLLTAQSRQKSYANRKVLDLEFMFGEWVLLKVSPMKAYELALPPDLSDVHPVIRISMLKKYHSDGAHVIQWVLVLLDLNFTFEEGPVAILGRQIRKLRSNEIVSGREVSANVIDEGSSCSVNSSFTTRKTLNSEGKSGP
ncbi:uncharacterized protein LOC132042667 [Lycium ferocissimum]|uniref:uncharacterized protein LOC132042667 n=1 Tax=Lycium ferocissimum TaxID=112874 RepID=UPI00281569EC|nr:uncharacterized protein LOC132042667 [Lycium ferocissimum]